MGYRGARIFLIATVIFQLLQPELNPPYYSGINNGVGHGTRVERIATTSSEGIILSIGWCHIHIVCDFWPNRFVHSILQLRSGGQWYVV